MQALDPTGFYDDADVITALTARQGVRSIAYRYDRLSELNNYIEPVDWVVGGSVANNSLADIKRTAKFRVLDRGSINYLKDRIRPWACLSMPDGGTVEWPLGVFVLSTPARGIDQADVVTRDVDAYDQLLVLSQDKVGDRYSVAAGVLYTTAISTLTFGYASNIVPSTLALPAPMEWPPSTSYLRILNDLLAAINYQSASFDELGRLVCQPYLSPASRSSEYTYADGEASVRTGTAEQTLDLFNIPNKWVLVKSEADQAALTSTYTNTSATSPTSTVSRGRTIVDFRDGEDAADQTTLDAKAARYAFEASQVFESLKFSTLAMPMHSNADVITLNIPGLAVDAKYSEQAWSLPLAPGATMTHEARRVVTI